VIFYAAPDTNYENPDAGLVTVNYMVS